MNASKSRAICVDLDATLARYSKWEDGKKIGPPLEGSIQFMRAIRTRGLKIIILTARLWPTGPDGTLRETESVKTQIENWLLQHKIPFDEIHGKPIAAAYVDDRAISVRKNPPPGDFSRALAEIEQLAEMES